MIGARTRPALLLAIGMLLTTGCAQRGPAPLYLWESFPRQQYDTLVRAGVAPVEQIVLLDAHAEKARGAGAALPPGFRAHLGMLKLSVGAPEQARDLWEAEKSAFPESAPYIDRLIKRLQPPATTGNPA